MDECSGWQLLSNCNAAAASASTWPEDKSSESIPPWHHQRTPTATGSAWFLQCETMDFVKTYFYFQYSKTQKKNIYEKKSSKKKKR